jgi:DNA ligase 4
MISFRFSYIADLLENIEALELQWRRPVARPLKDKEPMIQKLIENWFTKYKAILDPADSPWIAILSLLLPARQPKRVYHIQVARLHGILCRALKFSSEKTAALRIYEEPGNGDLAECLWFVLKEYNHNPLPGVLCVQQVNNAFEELASRCILSDNHTQCIPTNVDYNKTAGILRPSLLKCRPTDAKWLVRLLLRDLSPVTLDESKILEGFHFILPALLRVQNDLHASISMVQQSLRAVPRKVDANRRTGWCEVANYTLRPSIGVKVGLPTFRQAWSTRNCLQLAKSNVWRAEYKYDGKYCQIHIDLTKKQNESIQIISKSGRHLAVNNSDLYQAIRMGLQIEKNACEFRRNCIIIGELVRWHVIERRALPFYSIKRYATYSNHVLEASGNSQ